jgi:HNH endonuclease
MPWETRTCKRCGKTFDYRVLPSRPATQGWYCSRDCSNRRERTRATETRTCRHCGATFKYMAGGKPGTGPQGKFCSRECSNKADKRRVRGPEHGNWKGGRVKWPGGYMAVRIDGKYVLEHRHVMSQKLGRPLSPHETIHHKNGDRSDNRIENLELRAGRHGKGATEAHCPTCTCFEH